MIDFDNLPTPDFIEQLDFDTVLSELKSYLAEVLPGYGSLKPEDPITQILETFAYRELMLRARINEAGRSVLVPTATGSNLDNIAVFYGISRHDLESDEDLRKRISGSLNGLSTAGTLSSYKHHALAASSDVRDACVHFDEENKRIIVTILTNKLFDELDSEVSNFIGIRSGLERLKPSIQKLIKDKIDQNYQHTILYNSFNSNRHRHSSKLLERTADNVCIYLYQDHIRPLTHKIKVIHAIPEVHILPVEVFLDNKVSNDLKEEIKIKLKKYIKSIQYFNTGITIYDIYKNLTLNGVKRVDIKGLSDVVVKKDTCFYIVPEIAI